MCYLINDINLSELNFNSENKCVKKMLSTVWKSHKNGEKKDTSVSQTLLDAGKL